MSVTIARRLFFLVEARALGVGVAVARAEGKGLWEFEMMIDLNRRSTTVFSLSSREPGFVGFAKGAEAVVTAQFILLRLR